MRVLVLFTVPPNATEMVCPECVRLVIRARYRQELKHDFCDVIDEIHRCVCGAASWLSGRVYVYV
jgi:hypothetical protein